MAACAHVSPWPCLGWFTPAVDVHLPAHASMRLLDLMKARRWAHAGMLKAAQWIQSEIGPRVTHVAVTKVRWLLLIPLVSWKGSLPE